MKRLFFLALIFYSCSVLSPFQKSRVISLYHLIESGQFADAKTVTEELVEGEESSQWASTWYARGYLCQTAYTAGMQTSDPKLFELYPDQLYVAWESYEKARMIDGREKMERQLAPKYVLLANDFQHLGMKHITDEQYSKAVRAFEQALRIEKLPFMSLKQDTMLVYNTALAAWKNKNWNKAKSYLETLHRYRFSENATHLLYRTYISLDDTAAAEKALFEGVTDYQDHENLVLLLAELLYEQSKITEAIAVIDRAISENPVNAKYHYNKGLIFQMEARYVEAIEAYEKAINFNPDNLMAYCNIATCYYNIGVTYEENTRRLTSNQAVKKERIKSETAFQSALTWLDNAIARQPQDGWVIQKLSRLYNELGKPDKTRGLLINIE